MSKEDLQQLLYSAKLLVENGLSSAAEFRARLVAADTISVAMAAGRRPEAMELVADHPLLGRVRYEAPGALYRSSLLTANGGWASAESAAYINGSILCALEMDEGTRPTGHPAAHIIPAVLAAAEAWELTVGDVLEALLYGYEVSASLLEAHTLAPGIHPHGHLGGIGAAAAVAHLADADPLPAAEVAATSMLATHWGSCLDGASARNTWTGQSAAAAVRAYQLATSGWTGGTSVLDSVFDGLLAQETQIAVPDPQRPRIFNGYFKFYSACALTHTSIEAALGITGFDAEDVQSVSVRTTRNNLKVANGSLETPLSRRFSIPFAVATALVEGVASPAAFDEPNELALSMARRIHVEEDPTLSDQWPDAAPAVVEVLFTDGSTRSARCDNAKGVTTDGSIEQELRAKTIGLHEFGDALWSAVMEAPGQLPIEQLMKSVQAMAR